MNITRRDSRTKRKKGNVRCAIRKVRDQRGFTGGIGKTDALKVANIEKKVLRIESMMCSVSCSDKSVERTKYATTHAVKSLMKTEGEEERERMQRKTIGNYRLTIRFGADGWRNNRANRKLAAADCCVL